MSIFALFSPDNGTISFFDSNKNEILSEIRDYDRGIWLNTISPDGRTFAAVSKEEILLWDMHTGEQVGTLKGHTDWVKHISFSPDGLTLASGASDHTVRLWDVPSAKELVVLDGHKGRVEYVSFSSDGKMLASSSDDNTIRLYTVSLGKETAVFQGHGVPVHSISFSPDGNTLASSNKDRTISAFDVHTGNEIVTFSVPDRHIDSIFFSPDGNILVSRGNDVVRFWDTEKWNELAVCRSYYDSNIPAFFSSDGKILFVSEGGHELERWGLGNSADLLERLQTILRIGSSLTFDEHGVPVPQNPVLLARTRLDAAKAGRIWWREDGGKSLVPLYENELAQATKLLQTKTASETNGK